MHWKKRQLFALFKKENWKKKTQNPGDLFLDMLLHAYSFFPVIPDEVLEQEQGR